MVCLADIRSFLEASCCRVEVVKGAAGLLVDGLDSTDSTLTFISLLRIEVARFSAAARSRSNTPSLISPLSLKASPDAIRLESIETSFASKSCSLPTLVVKRAFTSW